MATSVYISNSGLTSLPSNLNPNLKELKCSCNNLSSLQGLSRVTALTRLDASFNSPLTSLGGIEGVRFLTYLNVSHCGLSSLASISSSLVSLTELSVANNLLSSLAPLSSLRSLESLWCESNQVRDLQSLSTLKKLTFLQCGSNWISSLEPLSLLQSLEQIYFYDNDVSSLKPVTSLSRLKRVICAHNPLASLVPLASMASLSQVIYSFDDQQSLIDALLKKRSNIQVVVWNRPRQSRQTQIRGVEKGGATSLAASQTPPLSSPCLPIEPRSPPPLPPSLSGPLLFAIEPSTPPANALQIAHTPPPAQTLPVIIQTSPADAITSPRQVEVRVRGVVAGELATLLGVELRERLADGDCIRVVEVTASDTNTATIGFLIQRGDQEELVHRNAEGEWFTERIKAVVEEAMHEVKGSMQRVELKTDEILASLKTAHEEAKRAQEAAQLAAALHQEKLNECLAKLMGLTSAPSPADTPPPPPHTPPPPASSIVDSPIWRRYRPELRVLFGKRVLDERIRDEWTARLRRGELPIADDEKLLDFFTAHPEKRYRVLHLMKKLGFGAGELAIDMKALHREAKELAREELSDDGDDDDDNDDGGEEKETKAIVKSKEEKQRLSNGTPMQKKAVESSPPKNAERRKLNVKVVQSDSIAWRARKRILRAILSSHPFIPHIITFVWASRQTTIDGDLVTHFTNASAAERVAFLQLLLIVLPRSQHDHVAEMTALLQLETARMQAEEKSTQSNE